jgi:hypothetical protein
LSHRFALDEGRAKLASYGDSLADFIGNRYWDYFFTVTTRKPRKDSISLIQSVWKWLNHEDYGFNLQCGFLATEPFKYQKNLHLHGILKNQDSNAIDSYFGETYHYYMQRSLNYRFGRSRVEVCRSNEQVSGYCTKYVTKITDGDNYDFAGDW